MTGECLLLQQTPNSSIINLHTHAHRDRERERKKSTGENTAQQKDKKNEREKNGKIENIVFSQEANENKTNPMSAIRRQNTL